MRINSFNQNLIPSYNRNYNAKPIIKDFADNYTFCHNPNKAPAINFTGLSTDKIVKKLNLPAFLQELKGEVYKITLFDKTKRENVEAFLQYADSKDAKSSKKIMIYDKKTDIIGSVGLDFSEWKEKNTNLPKNYVRLHMLENNNRKKYSGVGSAIIQAAVEKSLKTDAKGRIYVYSYNLNTDEQCKKNDPFIFYNKMGFSLVKPWSKAKIILSRYTNNLSTIETTQLEKRVGTKNLPKVPPDELILATYETAASCRGCKAEEVYFDFAESMYLHDDKVESLWIPRIKANPIFTKSNKIK